MRNIDEEISVPQQHCALTTELWGRKRKYFIIPLREIQDRCALQSH